MMTDRRTLRSDEPLAVELTAALKQGEVDRLSRLLAADPWLARSVVQDPKGGGRSPLHLFADWPGHLPNAAVIVPMLAAAGADLDAPAVGMWHRETPLHWAASNDDVELIDALPDAGADIERAGSSIDGGPPLSSAVGYGQWVVARQLIERGQDPVLARSGVGVDAGDHQAGRSRPATTTRGAFRAVFERLSRWAACRRTVPAGARRRSQLACPLVGANAARHRGAGRMERCCGLANRKAREPREERP